MTTLTPSSISKTSAKDRSFERYRACAFPVDAQPALRTSGSRISRGNPSISETMEDAGTSSPFFLTSTERLFKATGLDFTLKAADLTSAVSHQNVFAPIDGSSASASLNPSWERIGFLINFVAIVTAIAYVVLT